MPLSPDEGKRLIDVVQSLVQGAPTPQNGHRQVVARSPEGNRLVRPVDKPERPKMDGDGMDPIPLNADDVEKLYQTFKRRLLTELQDDPIYVRLLANAPTIDVFEQTHRVDYKGDSLKGRMASLLANGFFDTGKTQGATRTEMKRTGTEPNGGNLSRAFSEFVVDGFLTREAGDTFIRSPRVVVNVKRGELEA